MSDPKVIERPTRVVAVPGHLSASAHKESLHAGQRVVTDLFLDEDEDRLVMRAVNMATGKVVWVALEEAESPRVTP